MLIEQIAVVLQRYVQPGDRLVVGLSGGLDSVVLLSSLQMLRSRFNFELAAHHVNHQISRNSSDWAKFCAEFCAMQGVAFTQTSVEVPKHTGKGLEAAARASRQSVFLQLDADFIVLGHHQDDQAETLLLRLLRGAGIKGLAAMAECCRLSGKRESAFRPPPRILRPLLRLPRSVLAAFARAEGLRWIEDESNADLYYARNYLRGDLLPRLEKRFPAYRRVFDRAAAQFAEADQLLDALAALDAEGAINEGKIAIAAFSRLDELRAKNLLRYFLGRHDLKMPDHDRLKEMLRQLTTTRCDTAMCIMHDGVELRRFAGQLHVVHPLPLPPADLRLSWRGELRWVIPVLQGTLIFQESPGKGIVKTALFRNDVTIRLRQGGEKLRIGSDRPRQTLKNLLQEIGIPPWERGRLPLLYIGDALACVPGVGVDAAFQAQPDMEGISVYWMPDSGIRRIQ